MCFKSILRWHYMPYVHTHTHTHIINAASHHLVQYKTSTVSEIENFCAGFKTKENVANRLNFIFKLHFEGQFFLFISFKFLNIQSSLHQKTMAFSRNACIFVLSLALCICVADPISSIELTRENFDEEIKGKNTLVIFYSPR